tara:strand:+ start:705 stop:1241 length:537 start_codon:yes stop_codon:yes gene_type:complete
MINLKNLFSEWGFTLKGLKDNRCGEWWLAGQLSIIVFQIMFFLIRISKTGFDLPLANLIFSFLMLLTGSFIGINGFIDLGKSLSPLPEPKQGSALITNGLYKHCRHPIYQALIILSIGMLLYCMDLLNIILLVLLSIVLIGKAKREEVKLKSIHNLYKSYMEKTPAIFARVPIFDWRD